MTFKIETINNGYLVYIFMTDNPCNGTSAEAIQYAYDAMEVSTVVQNALNSSPEKPKNRVI
jgi:hypothetical protein